MQIGNFGFLTRMVVMEEGATVPGGNTNRLHGKLAGGRAIASRARGRRTGRRSGGSGVVLGRRMQRRMQRGGVQYVAGGMRRMQLGGNVVTMRLKLRRKEGTCILVVEISAGSAINAMSSATDNDDPWCKIHGGTADKVKSAVAQFTLGVQDGALG